MRHRLLAPLTVERTKNNPMRPVAIPNAMRPDRSELRPELDQNGTEIDDEKWRSPEPKAIQANTANINPTIARPSTYCVTRTKNGAP